MKITVPFYQTYTSNTHSKDNSSALDNSKSISFQSISLSQKKIAKFKLNISRYPQRVKKEKNREKKYFRNPVFIIFPLAKRISLNDESYQSYFMAESLSRSISLHYSFVI